MEIICENFHHSKELEKNKILDPKIQFIAWNAQFSILSPHHFETDIVIDYYFFFMCSNFSNKPIVESLQTISLFYFIAACIHRILITTNRIVLFDSEARVNCDFKIRMRVNNKKMNIYDYHGCDNTVGIHSMYTMATLIGNAKENILISIFDGIPHWHQIIPKTQNKCIRLISTN